MKKYFALLLLLPTALMVAGGAAAQRKNTTSHDVKPVCACTDTDNCPCAGRQMSANGVNRPDTGKEKSSYQKKIDRRTAEQNEEINERYNSALKKINKAGLAQADAQVLQQIAENNRNTALAQVNQTAEAIKTGHRSCMKLSGDNHKLCKKLDKILILED